MQLFRLPPLDGVESMATFHSAAELGVECLIITSPTSPFVSTGYFDNAAKILHVDKLKESNIPVFRRRIGGGAVLLDKNQVFYQLVLKRDNPLTPKVVLTAYKIFSKAPVEAIRSLGVDVVFRPVNDLVAIPSERKISGQGAGVIGDCFVFVGNILMDFDYDLMSSLFNVPESQRVGLKKSLFENVTTLERELGAPVAREKVENALIKAFREQFANLDEQSLPPSVKSKALKLCVEMTAPEYVYEEKGRPHEKIKIREGVFFDRAD